MTASLLTAECKFCSEVSKANGEDPTGSANPTDSWLVMELPLPWTEERFHHDPVLQPLHDLFHELFKQGIQVAPMLIAPDRDYSVPDRAHLFYYQRSAQGFGPLEKQTFLAPMSQIASIVKALLCQPEDLPQFADYQQPADDIREIMVCTHGNVDVACARFGQPIYKQLRETYGNPGTKFSASEAQLNPTQNPKLQAPHPPLSPSPSSPLRVWRCSHFGGHQFAPTLMDFPTGQAWGHLEPDILPALVNRDRPVTELRPFYRGLSGLTKFEQMVEREIWMQRDWEWLSYRKSAQILAQDSNPEAKEPEWAEVRLTFVAPDSGEIGAYEARVEADGSVMTAHNSGEAPAPAKQYRVSRLVQVTHD